MKRVSCDFEFSNSNEPNPQLVCCSLQVEGSEPEEYWLYKTPRQYNLLRRRLEELQDHIFIAHAATAEGRCFIALGLDPTKFQWIDTYFLRKQLTNKCNKFQYGRYFDKNGKERYSTPPSFQTWKNTYSDNTEVKAGLVDTVGFHLGKYVDSEHKNLMRDIIIRDNPEEVLVNKKQIMDYCTSDIVYLFDLADVMLQSFCDVTFLNPQQALNSTLRNGRYAADLAWMENIGIPIDMDAVRNLEENYEIAKEELIGDLVENHFPFYVKEKSKTVLGGEWKFKTSQVVAFVESKGLQGKWPKTATGNYKTDDETLDGFSHLPEISALRECNKQVGQLKWFRPDSGSGFTESVGSDNNLRTFLGPFGTISARNAAPAKRFPFAMSSWIRAIIKPNKGEVIVACDYSSQEFYIAAMMSGDKEMIEAYRSSDPYLYFAKATGAIPMDADPKKVKNPAKCLEVVKDSFKDIYRPTQSELDSIDVSISQEYHKYYKYSDLRGLYKATTLGLQFGMAYASLAKKLSLDMKREVSEEEAKALIDMHKKLYRVFWKWNDGNLSKYKRQKHFTLWDGWTLLGDNESDLSMKNFPVQGSGSVMMRLAVRKCHDLGIRVMNPLHDAVYIRCAEGDEERIVPLFKKCMTDACYEMFGDSVEMRGDVDVHRHDEVWIEDKGRKNYARLGKFLQPLVTGERARIRRLERILGAV